MAKSPDLPYKASPMTKEAPGDGQKENLPGQDLKKARGLDKNGGHSPNEAGTDQRVEDAKKARKSGH